VGLGIEAAQRVASGKEDVERDRFRELIEITALAWGLGIEAAQRVASGKPAPRRRAGASMKCQCGYGCKCKAIAAAAAVGLSAAVLPAWAGTTVYVPLGSANKVIAVDAASDRVLRTFDGIENPHGLVATPDGQYLVAGSMSERPLPRGAAEDMPNSRLSVIHPAHGHVMSTIGVAGWTHHQAITPDGRYVLSTHPARGAISVADLTANKLVRTIATGPAPNYAVVTPDGSRVYVSNSGNGTVSEIDARTWKVLRTLEAGPSPEHMVLAPDGKRLFVANDRGGQVTEVSLASGRVERRHALGERLHGLDISDDGRWLYASLVTEDKLIALDAQTGARRTLPLSPAPYHLGAVRGTGKLYVSSSREPKIWVVDQASLKLVGGIELPGGEGHQLAISR